MKGKVFFTGDRHADTHTDGHRDSMTELAPSPIQSSSCVVQVFILMSPPSEIYFQASHWPTGHMTRSQASHWSPSPHPLRGPSYVSCVMCHVSHVTCHMSHVTCHVSRVTCHVSHVTYIFVLPPPPKKNYWYYDPHRLRDSVSPVCGIFLI